jgi:hypothetical protein
MTTPEDRFLQNIQALINISKEPLQKCYDLGLKCNHPMMLDFAVNFLESFDKKKLIENFIEKSFNDWDKIKERNIEYFLKNIETILEETPFKKSTMFETIYKAVDSDGNKVLTEELQDQLWEAIHGMIKICISYIHKERQPVIKEVDGEKKYIYRNQYMKHINLKTVAHSWNKELIW